MNGDHHYVEPKYKLVGYLVESKLLQLDLLIVLDNLFAQKIRYGLNLVFLGVHKVWRLQKVLLRKYRDRVILAMTIFD